MLACIISVLQIAGDSLQTEKWLNQIRPTSLQTKILFWIYKL